jgi:hypothetical protein
MSIYASINGNDSEFFSSNLGWQNVTEWASELDVEKFEDLIHLVEHGYTDDAQKLLEQIRLAIDEDKPDKKIHATLFELLRLLDGETGEVIIDSGIESD